MAYTYLYWGLSQVEVHSIQVALQKAGQSVNLEHKGSTVSAISLKSAARKVTVAGAILLKTEYDSISNYLSSFDKKVLDKIMVVETYSDLEKLFESELGISFADLAEPEPVATQQGYQQPVVAQPVHEQPSVSKPVYEPPVVELAQPTVEVPASVTEVTPSYVKSEPVVPTQSTVNPFDSSSNTNVFAESPEVVEKPTVSPAVEDGVVLEDLEDELLELRERLAFTEQENVRLRSQSNDSGVQSQLNSLLAEQSEWKAKEQAYIEKMSSMLSPEALKERELEWKRMETAFTTRLDSLSGQVESLTSKLTNEGKFISELQQQIQTMTSERLNILSQLEDAKRGIREELPSLVVPKNLSFAVSASSLSVTHTYQHLLKQGKDAIFIDLSRESFIDMLVKLPNPIRVTKWLLEGIQLRTIFSKMAMGGVETSEGLSIVASPNVVLSDDLFERVDWVECFSQIEETGRPTTIYLGLGDYNGVSEFINRLSTSVKVYRKDNPAELRAYNKLAYMHENVEEVILP